MPRVTPRQNHDRDEPKHWYHYALRRLPLSLLVSFLALTSFLMLFWAVGSVYVWLFGG
jgi:hypothetical protein